MKKWKQIAAVVCVAACAGMLAGCGASGAQGQGGTAAKTAESSKDSGKSGEKKADTWQDAIGGSGYVEYEFEGAEAGEGAQADSGEDGDWTTGPSKMTLKRDSGAVWRTIEYTRSDYGDGSGMEEARTYDANGDLIYILSTYYQSKGEESAPANARGTDVKAGKDDDPTSSQVSYSGSSFESTNLTNTKLGAVCWSVTSYDKDGQAAKTTEYFRDGLVLGQWEYVYEKGKLAEVKRFRKMGTGLSLKPEWNDAGQMTALVDKNDETKIVYTMEYDGAGRLTKRTGYNVFSKVPFTQTFTYREDGSLSECSYECTDLDVDFEKVWIPRFAYDEAGNLVWESYGNLKGTYGSGDIMMTQYEYHGDGKIAKKRGYCLNDRSTGGLRMEYEYTYGDDGVLDRTLEMDYDYDSSEEKDYYGTTEEEYYDNGKVKTRWVVHASWPDELTLVEFDEEGKSPGGKRADMDKERGGEYTGQFDVGEW